MLADHPARPFPPRLWGALVATVVAFVVALVASANLYLLEDGNPLTAPAYLASPLLRFSYDVVYLSALVAVVTVCAIVVCALAQRTRPALAGAGLIALVMALGGFGGLLLRQPLTFLWLFMVYSLLVLGCFFGGWALAARTRPALGEEGAGLLGVIASAGLALLVNAVAMVAHTLALNPVSHALYMQGRLGTSHFNGVLLGMGLEALLVGVALVSLAVALRKS